jgi:hypothetical protein
MNDPPTKAAIVAATSDMMELNKVLQYVLLLLLHM